jgi:hypothetical protein
MASAPNVIRYLVEAFEKVLLVVAVLSREYRFSLLIFVVVLISAKIYADLIEIYEKKRGKLKGHAQK